jgi:hypothetical protein
MKPLLCNFAMNVLAAVLADPALADIAVRLLLMLAEPILRLLLPTG